MNKIAWTLALKWLIKVAFLWDLVFDQKEYRTNLFI